MQPHRIEDWDDPRVADYRNLKDADLLRRDRFIVEGRGNLQVLLTQSTHRPHSILLSERAWHSLRDELTDPAIAETLYVAEQSVLDRVVGFSIHRGVLASCPRPALPSAAALTESVLGRGANARLVVLEGLTNHDNVGGIFRSAMAFGVQGVLLCARSCDPLYRKATRTSMGGSLIVPYARAESVPDTLSSLRAKGFSVVALDPDPAGQDLAALSASALGPVALVVGTEGAGLSEAACAEATHRVRIDMEPNVDSLNVSVATAIALHRFRPDYPGRP